MRFLFAGLVLAGCGVLDAQSNGDPPGGAPDSPANPLCAASDAKAAFGTNAVCVCEDLDLLGKGFIAKPTGEAPANVGVNGTSWIVGVHEIGGSLIAMKGIAGVGDLTTHGNFSTAGDVLSVGFVTVKGDMMVGGMVKGVALLDVDGTLGVQDESKLLGTQRFGRRGPYVAPAEPCGCGAPAVDVAAKVAEARSSGKRLGDTTSVGRSALTLGTGSYYADSLGSLGVLELNVEGAAALSMGGSLDAIGLQRITVKPGATLDLYLEGGLATLGWSVVGEGASPGSVRIFVGGDRKLTLAAGLQPLNASIYAPKSVVALVGDTRLGGAVFAKRIVGAGRLAVDYAPPSGAAAEQCLTPQ